MCGAGAGGHLRGQAGGPCQRLGGAANVGCAWTRRAEQGLGRAQSTHGAVHCCDPTAPAHHALADVRRPRGVGGAHARAHAGAAAQAGPRGHRGGGAAARGGPLAGAGARAAPPDAVRRRDAGAAAGRVHPAALAAPGGPRARGGRRAGAGRGPLVRASRSCRQRTGGPGFGIARLRRLWHNHERPAPLPVAPKSAPSRQMSPQPLQDMYAAMLSSVQDSHPLLRDSVSPGADTPGAVSAGAVPAPAGQLSSSSEVDASLPHLVSCAGGVCGHVAPSVSRRLGLASWVPHASTPSPK